MSEPSGYSIQTSQMHQIDLLCNEFEAACIEGTRPVIQDYLDRTSPEIQALLLPELLQLEEHYRIGDLKDELPQLPGYTITSELGRGGMGIVYLATDLRLLRQVAVKMIHPTGRLLPENRRRFLREARAAARLHHPNLVQVFEAGDHQGTPYLVLELVQGGTLADRIGKKPVDFVQVAQWMESVCRAVQLAHEHQIVHRDLKPANILIGADGVVRVSDFGLAKQLDEDVQQTQSGTLVGTPSYMAPEQASGLAKASTAAADIYSLGAILYELLTGQPPFKAASVMETLEQLRTREPTAPHLINPHIPRDLETICVKCLQKEPTRRYMSAELLADELKRFIHGDSIISRPIGPIERTERWCRRHPLPTALFTALVVVLLAGLIAVRSQWREADHQRQIAELNAQKFLDERDIARSATELAQKKTQEAEALREVAEKHLAASESRFKKAQAPIQELIQLSSELLRTPHMNERGKIALAKATGFHKDLLVEKSDDPKSIYITASTLNTLGQSMLNHGQPAEAKVALQDAIELSATLYNRQPNNLSYARLHRDLHLWFGMACSSNRESEKAEELLRQSVLISEQVLNLRGSNSSDDIALGAMLNNLAFTLGTNKKNGEANEVRMRGLDVLRRCAEKYPNDIPVSGNLALALTNLASILWKKDKVAAETLLLEALAILRSRMISHPEYHNNRARFASVSVLLASWYRTLKRFDEGKILLKEAEINLQELCDQFPKIVGYRKEHVKCLTEFARIAAASDGDVVVAANAAILVSERAVQDLPFVEEIVRDHAYCVKTKGQALIQRGQKAEGIELLRVSLRDYQKLRASTRNSATIKREVEEVARAIFSVADRLNLIGARVEAAEARLANSPEDPRLLNSLAWELVSANEPSAREPGRAEEYARRAIERSPAQPFFYNTLAVALFYQDRLAEAEQAFTDSQELCTTEPAMDWLFMAQIRYQQGKKEEAKEYLERAAAWQAKHRPTDAELIEHLARTQSVLQLKP